MRENWASNILTKIFIFLIILFTVLQMILMGSMIFAKFSKRFLLKIIINFRKKSQFWFKYGIFRTNYVDFSISGPKVQKFYFSHEKFLHSAFRLKTLKMLLSNENLYSRFFGSKLQKCNHSKKRNMFSFIRLENSLLIEMWPNSGQDWKL